MGYIKCYCCFRSILRRSHYLVPCSCTKGCRVMMRRSNQDPLWLSIKQLSSGRTSHIIWGGGGGGWLLNIDLTTKLDHFWNSIDGKRVLANKYRDIPPSKVKIFSLLINVAVVRRMALQERFCNGKTDTKWRKIVRKKFLVTFWPSQFDEPE